jgi:hypothetical protein
MQVNRLCFLVPGWLIGIDFAGFTDKFEGDCHTTEDGFFRVNFLNPILLAVLC